jgi:Uma2 family endonuclease
MIDALKILLNAPNAHVILEEAQNVLSIEHQKREAFYNWVNDTMKAEFIHGKIVMHSPSTHKHTLVRWFLENLLGNFCAINNLGIVCSEKAMVHLSRNSYEPDLAFWGNAKAATITDTTLLYPAPDFVVEVISKESRKRDRVIKFEDYAQHGVAEYWIIEPQKQLIEQYALLVPSDTKYRLIKKLEVGEDIESWSIKGFDIPVAAVFSKSDNLQALKELLGKKL